jgi:hypothetical protein
MTMIPMRAPRNHTSVYFCDYIKKHWSQFRRLQTNEGYKSFNSFANSKFVEMLKQTPTKIKNTGMDLSKRINPYDDSKATIKEKLKLYTDGELLDLINLSTGFRNILIHDYKKRDCNL